MTYMIVHTVVYLKGSSVQCNDRLTERRCPLASLAIPLWNKLKWNHTSTEARQSPVQVTATELQ